MRYLALAADFDGTIATDGRVTDEVDDALRRLGRSGRRLILVTGRELPDLERVYAGLDLFDRIVAENGALLYRPANKEQRALAPPPDAGFVAALRDRGVEPLSVGSVIVATWHPNDEAVLETIRERGLELQVIFNKGAVMVLPSGVNKATGLAAALDELGLSPHSVVGVGDAENDHAFLQACECAVATANAVPALADACDLTLDARNGAGVVGLVERILADDLAGLAPPRHRILVGEAGGEEVRLDPFGHNILVAGQSGSGKSTFTTGFVERLCAAGYQVCVVDPEGDYGGLEAAIELGDASRAPAPEEAIGALERPGSTVTVNLLGLRMDDRPSFLEAFLPRIQELRSRTGRPHWVVVDEAHHMLHPDRVPSALTLPGELGQFLFVTVHPDRIAPEVLGSVETLVATGAEPGATLAVFADAAGVPEPGPTTVPEGQALLWNRRADAGPLAFTIAPPHADLKRHVRKYAEGELGDDKSFYFRGPDARLNLRAQNLDMFLQIGEGVDDETWDHHLRTGDYTRWFRDMIKDESLADEVAPLEHEGLDAAESRARVRAAIEERYTAAP